MLSRQLLRLLRSLGTPGNVGVSPPSRGGRHARQVASVRAAAEMDHRGRQRLAAHAAVFRDFLSGLPSLCGCRRRCPWWRWCFFYFPFLSASSFFALLVLRVYVYMYHGYVPGIISLQAVRDGVPQLVIVPFPCVLVLRCTYFLFSSIETFIVS